MGRQDFPTDAVEEYCIYLGAALAEHGIPLEKHRVLWLENGWQEALRELQKMSSQIRNARFLVQYTALSWSAHGFSRPFLKVLRILKKHGAWCAVVFHDADGYYGNRFVDRLRRAVQLHTMRKALRLCDLGIMTIPIQNVPWLPRPPQNLVYIPVGANLPSPEKAWLQESARGTPPGVAVFSLSGPSYIQHEVQLIAQAIRYAAERLGSLRLVVMGRNAQGAEKQLREELTGTQAEITVYGLLAAEQVVRLLGCCDVMLFVRGPISSRRGSAIAGIACGLPVVAREGLETAPPLTDAGVHLIPADDTSGYGPALLQVLTDAGYRASLAERSRRAQQLFFSWQAIAAKYASVLQIHTFKD